ncbi:hypothetical protein CEUSTIGMA_g8529.t1 [Chlamydomonas eustigma]|uniref:Dynein assembly factor 3 C-terminal domain-containing protein n=1 Tax=Chlamydomonas eustigma TaxID=1157962 RepID=A0A250XDD7_9CHLO|nr:hypothetical protein CEUSTIGMA_g8529.t1 [Chlamydomonas eustigma]|eukprot:GAX81095.1 hypothetical protein CEUSTIGMA_g8529.t1 [Chlamydomonas eustigma]
MDDQNVHHFWGLSPFIDLSHIALTCNAEEKPSVLRILQVAPYDARHTIASISRLERYADHFSGPLQMFVFEEHPEGLARHILLISVFLDGSIPAKERVEVLLELHGNALLREKTAEYLDRRGRVIEKLLVALISGTAPNSAEIKILGEDMVCLAHMLDISHLKFQDVDALLEVLRNYRMQVNYDMIKAWEARCRKWYGDRYDFKRNMIDWDYHMRLQTAGTPGQDSALGSIIHFHHFRHWRAHGVAYELRDSTYTHPNRSLLSTAFGRTKEFKDRALKDVGRSVSAWGYWGDVLNGPYHAFGVTCEEEAFFVSSNKQYTRTAVDIAEYNLKAFLMEWRSGQHSPLEPGDDAPRARLARGPTSIADLETISNATTTALEDEQHRQQQQQHEDGHSSTPLQDHHHDQNSNHLSNLLAEDEQKACQQDIASREETVIPVQHLSEGKGMIQSISAMEPEVDADDLQQHQGDNTIQPKFISCGRFQGRRNGYLFKSGLHGTGYYLDLYQSSTWRAAPIEDCAQSASSSSTAATLKVVDHSQLEMSEDVAGDVAAYERLVTRGVKLVLLTGDIQKSLTSRKTFHGFFDVITLGCRHIHMAGVSEKLDQVASSSSVLLIESAKHLLQLKQDQVDAFHVRVEEITSTSGWVRDHYKSYQANKNTDNVDAESTDKWQDVLTSNLVFKRVNKIS